ncbi:hypothetical protein CDD81_6387 [Ophiocordyceps australis]|uniref:Uncharacterized protein n=1 Tax=Ophiocordyceps australis TaxID=1399860 RepID=A0A2C5Y6U7_9HYPO|nr:hypothetical protein CDD81_6387 [Ophiocordyceps australis]
MASDPKSQVSVQGSSADGDVVSEKTMGSWTSRSAPGSYAYEHFSRRGQLRQLLLATAARWVTTTAIAGCMLGMLWGYSTKEVMPAWKKRELDVLIICCTVCLSVSIGASLTAMVRQMRWWLLSLDPTPPREADLILQCHNIGKLTTLGWVTRRWTVRAFVAVWLLLHAVSQVPLAALGLSYNINMAVESVLTRPGLVAAADVSEIKMSRSEMKMGELGRSGATPSIHALHHTANSYGLAGITNGIPSWGAMPKPGALLLFEPLYDLVYCNTSASQSMCSYVFIETPPLHSNEAWPVATNRHVTVRTRCKSWPVIEGGNGRASSVRIFDSAADMGLHFSLPALYGPDQTMYIWEPGRLPSDDWNIVTALEASETDAFWYHCNVSVGGVANALLPQHQVGVPLKRLATAAIAMQGYLSYELNRSQINQVMQYHSYPAESVVGEPRHGNTSAMALQMAVFASCVIAMTARNNPRIELPGNVPLMGVALYIEDWHRIYLILGITVASQAVLGLIAALIASRVQVRGRSNLAMASLLAPALPAARHGWACVAGGCELAAAIEPAKLAYAARAEGGYSMEMR